MSANRQYEIEQMSCGLSYGLRRLALLALVSLLAACSNTSRTSLRAPSDVPAFTIDVAASEVKVIGSTDAEEVRTLGAAALSSMATLQGESSGPRASAPSCKRIRA